MGTVRRKLSLVLIGRAEGAPSGKSAVPAVSPAPRMAAAGVINSHPSADANASPHCRMPASPVLISCPAPTRLTMAAQLERLMKRLDIRRAISDRQARSNKQTTGKIKESE